MQQSLSDLFLLFNDVLTEAEYSSKESAQDIDLRAVREDWQQAQAYTPSLAALHRVPATR